MKKIYHFLAFALLVISFAASAQNVGIGTTTPLVKLHISGSADTTQLFIDANDAQTNNHPLLKFRSSTGSDLLWLHSDDPTNIFLGIDAGRVNDATVLLSFSGRFNTFIGNQAGRDNLTGSSNTAFGNRALRSNTTGYSNVVIGNAALYSNTDRSNLVAIGDSALYYNGIGVNASFQSSGNTAVGSKTLFSNTTGYNNTANGNETLFSNTTGGQNTANGFHTLYSNTTGSYNSAYGSGALYLNTTGFSNTANGYHALFENTTGANNTANGYSALRYSTTGNNNTANGNEALFSNTTGDYNTAYGYQGLYSSTTGFANTANGFRALYSNTTGIVNTATGYLALNSNITGSRNTGLGYNTEVGSGDLNHATAIGAGARVDCSGCMVLGAINGINNATVNTNVGIGTTSPDARLHIRANSGASMVQLLLDENDDGYARLRMRNTTASRHWDIAALPNADNTSALMDFNYNNTGTVFSLRGSGNATLMGILFQNSDARLKMNVLPVASLSTGLLKLKGYTYQWKNEGMDQSAQIGLLAQEVEKYFPQLVKTDEKGFKSVNYTGFIPLLIENMKEQKNEIDELKERIKALEKSIGYNK